MPTRLKLLSETYAIAKYATDDALPEAIYASKICIVSKSPHEQSVICEQSLATNPIAIDTDWRFLHYEGTIDDESAGIAESILKPLADANISVLAHTSYDNGFFGVKSSRLSDAIAALRSSDIQVIE